MKTCTQCAKRIETAAKKCRFCHHIFSDDEMKSGQQEYYRQSNVVGLVGLSILAVLFRNYHL